MWASRITTILAVMCLAGCGKDIDPVGGMMTVKVEINAENVQTRAIIPDELMVRDLNFMAFDEEGKLYFRKYISARESLSGGKLKVSCPIACGKRTTLVCCANFGYELKDIPNLESLKNARHHMAYADDLRGGMPMCGAVSRIWEEGTAEIRMEIERMLAEISISLDRSALDDDVVFNVNSVSLKNMPRSCAILSGSKALNESDIFAAGLKYVGREADALNMEEEAGRSRELSFLMLENMQGDLLDDTTDDSGKILNGPYAKVCTYVEMTVDYSGERKDGKVKYRFYPGEGNSNFDICRNCHYHFILCPTGDGLKDLSWRVEYE